jgi:hypothetical protein
MSLISFFKTDIIEFLCEEKDFDIIPHPIPAGKLLPDWFKTIPGYLDGKRDNFGSRAMSAKKCMPMIDGMNLGFIIPLAGDVNVRTNKDCSLIEVGNNPQAGRLIDFHAMEQLGGKTSPSYPGPAIKFINKIIIKTAPGYSTLFVPCLNHFENRFTCLSALVDTDKYPKQVNFPGVWNIPNFDDILPRGTPLITAIPIKRADQPKKAKVRVMTESDIKKVQQIHDSQQNRRHHYTKELRAKDEH